MIIDLIRVAKDEQFLYYFEESKQEFLQARKELMQFYEFFERSFEQLGGIQQRQQFSECVKEKVVEKRFQPVLYILWQEQFYSVFELFYCNLDNIFWRIFAVWKDRVNSEKTKIEK